MSRLEIEINSGWPSHIPDSLRRRVEEIISWKIEHEPEWYVRPGRTLFVPERDSKVILKVKGAGFYNPENVAFSGLKRTTTPVPEGLRPMPPLERAFKRDLIHVDPANYFPHAMQSVHSNYAPVGGMTLEAALNDQSIFSRLTSHGLSANRPVAAYRYKGLCLDGKPMGVSISELPAEALPITPYDIYLAWRGINLEPKALDFLRSYSGRREFLISNPAHRLEIIAKFSYAAGRAISEFSLKAGLYRFSGSPDNWNVQADTEHPFYFSDVDTSQTLESVDASQGVWEVFRNLLTAIHQWSYFFIPSLSYQESGYSRDLLRRHDFIEGMLLGFFPHADQPSVTNASMRIWDFLDAALIDINGNEAIPLRGGEYVLQKHYSRPVFYFVLLHILIDLIENSEVQIYFKNSDTTRAGIQAYIKQSAEDKSHRFYFPQYSPAHVYSLIGRV